MHGRFSLHLVFVLVVSVLSALLGAIFNHGLEAILDFHQAHPWCVWLLPLILLLTRFLESLLAKFASQKSEQCEQSSITSESAYERRLGFLLVPLTWMSHLGGASVGRESVAARLGRSIAAELKQHPRLPFSGIDATLAVRIGAACGFAAVFGTPFAAAIFALESLRNYTSAISTSNPLDPKGWNRENIRGRVLSAPLLCLVAAWVAHLCATRLFRVAHTDFPTVSSPLNLTFLWFLAALVVAACAACLIHKKLFSIFGRLFSAPAVQNTWALSAVALMLSALFSLPPFEPFKNLGNNFIHAAFQAPLSSHEFNNWDWAMKSVLTSICLGLGFRGGEVTPLLSMGVLLAVPIGGLLGIEPPLAAASGYSMMFAVVLNVPLTGAVLALETFGLKAGSAAILVCLWAGLIFYRLPKLFQKERL